MINILCFAALLCLNGVHAQTQGTKCCDCSDVGGEVCVVNDVADTGSFYCCCNSIADATNGTPGQYCVGDDAHAGCADCSGPAPGPALVPGPAPSPAQQCTCPNGADACPSYDNYCNSLNDGSCTCGECPGTASTVCTSSPAPAPIEPAPAPAPLEPSPAPAPVDPCASCMNSNSGCLANCASTVANAAAAGIGTAGNLDCSSTCPTPDCTSACTSMTPDSAPAPGPSPSGSGGGTSCITSHQLVTTRDGSIKTVRQLTAGDEILTGTSWSSYIGNIHNGSVQPTLIIHTEDSSVELTFDHLIRTETGFVHASDVIVGSVLPNGKVTRIYNGMSHVMSPLTRSGTLVINGFELSCFANIYSHTVAVISTLPLRAGIVNNVSLYFGTLARLYNNMPVIAKRLIARSNVIDI